MDNNKDTLERKSSLGSLPDRVEEQVHVSTNDNRNHNDDDDDDDGDNKRSNDDAYSTHGTAAAASVVVTLVARFGKEKITLSDVSGTTTIGRVKEMLHAHTRVLPKRQKLVGLVAVQGGTKGVHDDLPLSGLKAKGNNSKTTGTNGMTRIETVHQFILMGTPEEEIFVDPSDRDDLPDVVDDFDLDFNAGSDEWLNHVATGENLKKFTEETEVFIMNPPRDGKPLLVLDLDHTLLDFSSKSLQRDSSTQVLGQGSAARMKRPYMDDFLTKCYQHYDMVVWSQTSWRWLETKLTELGMLTHPGYKFCFVLDKTSMFAIQSTRKNGQVVKHHVKPLQIIWSKFDRWNSTNTCHIDDLRRNFALNQGSGLKCTAYYRKKTGANRDAELLGMANYLEMVAQSVANFDDIDFDDWANVVAGNSPLVRKNDKGS